LNSNQAAKDGTHSLSERNEEDLSVKEKQVHLNP